jgi:outer membrane lipoprotein-sorting protein
MNRWLIAAPAFALALAALPGAAATPPAIIAFDDAFSKVDDYTVTVHSREVKGDRTQDRTYHYAFKKPHFAKTDIVAGEGAGSGGVWNGGSQVHGHLKVAFMTFGKRVDLHDPQATSLRGYTIPDGLIQNEVDKYKEVKGDLTQRPGPVIDGVATDDVELRIADPSQNDGVTRMELFLSKQTHFPVRQVRWEGDKDVADTTFSDLKTNVGLKESDFPF